MSSIDVEGLKRLSGNDQAFVNDILKLYTERTESDLVELNEARTDENWNKVRFVVHRMRSAAVPLGLKELVIRLRKVENKLKANEVHHVAEDLDEIMNFSREALLDAKRRLQLV
jgi:HPt (histidine-containing phosphotransfer) domain-containing protein